MNSKIIGKCFWKICLENKKEKNSFSFLPLLSLFSARELFPGNRRPSSPLPFPPQPSSPPLFPRSAQRQPPAHHRLARPSTAASNRRRAFLAPVAAASRAHLSEPPPSPRGSATVRARRCSNRRPRLTSWERPPRALAATNSSRAFPRAPCCSPLSSSCSPSTGEARNRRSRRSPGSTIAELRTSARAVDSEPPPSPFLPW